MFKYISVCKETEGEGAAVESRLGGPEDLMTYRYSFDYTIVGSQSFWRGDLALIQNALELLRSEVQAWNTKALENGASNAPYEKEVADLDHMIAGGAERLSSRDRTICINGLTVGSLRYIKAGLVLNIARREREIVEKERQGWPKGVVVSLQQGMDRLTMLSQQIDVPPAEILEEVTVGLGRASSVSTPDWDVFISHASEDKENFVRPLVEKLRSRNLRVWVDEVNLTVGDSLNRQINAALSRSQFGIVVISASFLRKEWPRRELDGLTARESDGTKVILPIWHGVGFEDVRFYSPILADKYAVSSSQGIDYVVAELVRAMEALQGK